MRRRNWIGIAAVAVSGLLLGTTGPARAVPAGHRPATVAKVVPVRADEQPFHVFFAFDDGGPVPCPFLPCVVPGDITFFAANTTDLTIKDSAVILTVFGF